MNKNDNEDENDSHANMEPETEKFEIDYKIMMKMVVCDIDNLECMIHRCDSCPGFVALQTYVEKKFEEYDTTDEISYS